MAEIEDNGASSLSVCVPAGGKSRWMFGVIVFTFTWDTGWLAFRQPFPLRVFVCSPFGYLGTVDMYLSIICRALHLCGQ